MSTPSRITATITQIQALTAESVDISLEVDNALTRYTPGQYVTTIATIDGEEVRRSYSISDWKNDRQFSIGVKQVRGGKMSTFLCQTVKVGHKLEVIGPEGKFVTDPRSDIRRQHVFITAGSGITPVLPMIINLLEEEGMSTCHLLYGNRTEHTIMYKESVSKLESTYKDQLMVSHILSKPILKRQPGLSGLFKKPMASWQGLTGRISDTILQEWTEQSSIDPNYAVFYLCGPGDMIDQVTRWLESNKVTKDRIKKEFFTSSGTTKPSVDSDQVIAAQVEVTLKGKEYIVEVAPTETILDALIKLNLDPPHSCTSGACSSCVAQVTKGQTKMDACYALDDDEVKAGMVLTCQAHPTTPEVTLTYDV